LWRPDTASLLGPSIKLSINQNSFTRKAGGGGASREHLWCFRGLERVVEGAKERQARLEQLDAEMDTYMKDEEYAWV
jgi:hypothetical protein